MAYGIQASIGKSNYSTTIELGDFTIHADEPVELGGTNSAPSPGVYLRASLASCVAITLKMYVDRKGWDVGTITVAIQDQILDTGELKMNKILSFEQPISEDQEKRLTLIADKCPISKLLRDGVLQGTEVK